MRKLMGIRRVQACGLVMIVSLPLISGCNANFDKRELLVHFAPSATKAQETSAETQCTGVAPETSPESQVPTTSPTENNGIDRFLIDKADDKDISILEDCLNKQPGVIGVEDTNDNE